MTGHVRGYLSDETPFSTGISYRFCNSGRVYLLAQNCRSASLIGPYLAPLLNNLYIDVQHDSRIIAKPDRYSSATQVRPRYHS